VRGHWFPLAHTERTGGTRVYKALEEQTLFNVEAMMQINNLKFLQGVPKFERASARPPRTRTTSISFW